MGAVEVRLCFTGDMLAHRKQVKVMLRAVRVKLSEAWSSAKRTASLLKTVKALNTALVAAKYGLDQKALEPLRERRALPACATLLQPRLAHLRAPSLLWMGERTGCVEGIRPPTTSPATSPWPPRARSVRRSGPLF